MQTKADACLRREKSECGLRKAKGNKNQILKNKRIEYTIS
jgi:hypothetical protein